MKIIPSTQPKKKLEPSGVHAEPSHLLHVTFISKPVCHHCLGSNLWGHSHGIKAGKGSPAALAKN
jgi:hypothetical protein